IPSGRILLSALFLCASGSHGCSGPVIEKVPDSVTELLAATLEVRIDAPGRSRRGRRMLRMTAPVRRVVEHALHMLGIVRPVGRQMQASAVHHARCDERNEVGLDQAALLVTLLR